MKKLILSGVLACLLIPAFAVSWGGILDNNTSVNAAGEDFSAVGLTQSNGVHLSLNVPFNTEGTVKVVAEGSFKYVYTWPDVKASDSQLQLVPDCDLLKFSGSWATGGGNLTVDLGRFTISDFSGAVFAQKSDGLNISYNTALIKFGAYAGYTGLQNRLNVSMNDMIEHEGDENYYILTAPYIPVLVDVSYRALFETNTIGLQGGYFMPLSEDFTKKFYTSFLMNGPIGLNCAYNLKGTFGLNDMKDPMVDAYADINFYIAGASIVTAGAEFVSFETDGLKQFVSVTSHSAISDPEFAGGLVPKLSVIYAKNNLYASLTGKGSIVMTTEDTKFNGVDASAGFIYNLFSDLQLGCDVRTFIGIHEDAKASNNCTATLKAIFAF